MGKRLTIFGSIVLSLGLGAGAQGGPSSPGDAEVKEVGRTTEREVNVVLSSGFGSIQISKGEPEKILTLDSPTGKDETGRINVDYAVRNRVGYAEISLDGESREGDHGKKWLQLDGFKGDKCFLRFSDAIPISFDIELGVGKARIDLTGLQVKDFTLSAGATDVEVSFDQPNKATIENMSIEAGVSKFTGHNLGNANFKSFKFEGGVGAYILDFSGKMDTEVDADVEIGVGTLTIVVPKEVGAKVMYEKTWISHLECDSDFAEVSENQYTSTNYATATGRMNIKVQSAMGSVKIQR